MISTLPLLLLLAAQPQREVVDRVAALVEGEVVTLSEIEDRAERAERGGATNEALRRALDQVVAEKLLHREAQALQIHVTEQQIDAAVEDVRTRNRFTEEQLDRALEEQGLDRAAFREQLRRELETYQVLQNRVRSRVKVTDDELRNYYQRHPQEFAGEEEIHVRHIFLPVPEGASAAEEAKVLAQGEKVLRRLRAGEDFARLAREVSRGPSAADGGDLGWLRRGTIHRTLEDAAFTLRDGQVSDLVRAGSGLHIVKVEGRRRGGAKSFEQAKEEIRARLLDEQISSARKQYLDELRRAAHVEVKIPELRG